MSGIAKAVEAAGSQEALAQAMGCKQPAVSKWVRRGYAPLSRLRKIAEVTGVDRRLLYADIMGE